MVAIESKLKSILSDKTSGSSDLLKKIDLLLANQKNTALIKKNIILLKSRFKSFQNIQTYLNDLSACIKNNRSLEKYFQAFTLNRENINDRIYRNTIKYLNNKKIILTISNSGTVFEILKRLPDRKKRRVIVSESRPKLEGTILARKLSAEGFNVELITEAMSAAALEKCSCVLIGADIILRNKNIVNKIGSHPLAILARYFNKPFYVVADRSKLSRKIKYMPEAEKGSKVFMNRSDKMESKNIFFEVVPKRLITRIITE